MSRSAPGLASNALAAADRLAQSRERLRQALHDPGASHRSAAGGRPTGSWLNRLSGLPGAAVLLEGLRLWWARHPWRVYGLLAADAAKMLVKPLARQHPVALVLGAGALGVALRWVRPWRWLWRSGAATALLAGLLPQLLSHGVQATRRPQQPAQPAAHTSPPWRPADSSPL